MRLSGANQSAWWGMLTDTKGHPISSVEIHLIGGHGELVARTHKDGSFSFPDFPPNYYEVVVVSHGREIGHEKELQLSALSSPVRLTLTADHHLRVSQWAMMR
jgi:hypothetical protein